MRETLFPQLNLDEAWAKGAQGWLEIVVNSKRDSNEEQKVAAYLEQRITKAWESSNQSNGYKPLRDVIAQRYGFTKAKDFPVEQAENARKLMIAACHAADIKSKDQIPDYIYSWWSSGGIR